MKKFALNQLKSALAYYKMMNLKPNFSAIARETGIDRHRVSDLYKGKEVKVTRDKPSQLDYLKDEIREILKDPYVSITAAYFYLTDEDRKERKIKCSLSNFTKYVQKYNLNEKEKDFVAHVRYETDPGFQVQFDWVEDLKIETINGEIIEYNLFSATLGYSRLHYFEFSIGKTETDVKRCLLHAFEYFGGTTTTALTDNMSAIVSLRGNDKKIHPSVLQFFKDINVKLILCKPKTPETKGKCETSNKFIRWINAYNKRIEDEVKLYQVIYRLNKTVNERPNETTGVPPFQLFEKEKSTLLSINPKIFEDWNQKYLKTQRVPSTCLIYYKGKQYSVHPKYVGKRVQVEGIGEDIYIYYNKILISSHKISDYKINYEEEDYKAALRKTGLKEDLVEQYSAKNLERFKK